MSREIRRIYRRRAAGLTLLELLVVLAIMAALSTVAMQSLTQSADQARFEATQRTLTDLKAACLGEATRPGGRADAVSGFVADVGRLPRSLNELLVAPTDINDPNYIVPFAVGSAAATGQPHADVLVPRGWRGPYVHLPLGATAIRDGWGRDIAYDPLATTPVMLSLGADNALDTSGNSAGYNGDLQVAYSFTDYHGAMIVGKVYKLNGLGEKVAPTGATSVKVILFGPEYTLPTNPPADTAYRQYNGIVGEVKTIVADAGTGEYTFQFVSPTIGPRVLRAEINDVAAGSPLYVVIRPGESCLADIRVP